MATTRRTRPRAATVVNVRTNGNHGGKDPPHKAGWFAASPAAYISLALTILLNAGTFGFIYGSVLGRIDQLGKTAERHEAALEKVATLPIRTDRIEQDVRRIDTTLGSLSTLSADVAVIKAQLTQLNDNFRLLQTGRHHGGK